MPPKLFSDAQLKDRDIDTIKRFLRYRLGGYTVAIRDIKAGNRIFRGVVCDPMPISIARISYPRPEHVVRLGRANRISVPIFYGSVAASACFYEIQVVPGQRVALSEWSVLRPLWMHNLGFHPEALQRLGMTNISGRAQFANPIPNETKANARLRLQLSLAFTENVTNSEEYKYKLSIGIYENLFDRAEALPVFQDGSPFNRAAGAVYPAMRLLGAADNLAIFPEFVDKGLVLKSVRYVLVEDANVNTSSYKLLTIAIADSTHGDKITWRVLTTPDIDRRSYIGLENGHWVLRNGHGQIYDWH